VVEEVEAAAVVLASADAEEEARLAEVGREEAARQRAADGLPRELLAVLRDARRALQQRKEAAHVIELERRFKVLDGLIRGCPGSCPLLAMVEEAAAEMVVLWRRSWRRRRPSGLTWRPRRRRSLR
jgi:hypothetical protein